MVQLRPNHCRASSFFHQGTLSLIAERKGKLPLTLILSISVIHYKRPLHINIEDPRTNKLWRILIKKKKKNLSHEYTPSWKWLFGTMVEKCKGLTRKDQRNSVKGYSPIQALGVFDTLLFLPFAFSRYDRWTPNERVTGYIAIPTRKRISCWPTVRVSHLSGNKWQQTIADIVSSNENSNGGYHEYLDKLETV